MPETVNQEEQTNNPETEQKTFTQDELNAIVNDAYNLTLQAYQLVGSANWLSNEQRRQINTAISAVQALMYAYPVDYSALQSAASSLRSHLQAAGLM